MHAQLLQLCLTLWVPVDCSPPGFSRQEYFSGWLYLPPRNLPELGIEPRSPVLEACREPVWGTPTMAKVMRKEALHTQRRDRASGNPLFPSIYPQNQSPPLLFYALTYTSDFTGGWPPLPLSEKELTYSYKSIKIPGHDKSVSTYELLWRLSSLPVQVCLATCDCLQPLTCESHEVF